MKGEGRDQQEQERDRAASVKQRLANEHKLREAACNNQVEIVRTLLDLNTNPNAQDEVNLSPLVWLCRSLFLVNLSFNWLITPQLLRLFKDSFFSIKCVYICYSRLNESRLMVITFISVIVEESLF